jgi:hypothetical protein
MSLHIAIKLYKEINICFDKKKYFYYLANYSYIFFKFNNSAESLGLIGTIVSSSYVNLSISYFYFCIVY